MTRTQHTIAAALVLALLPAGASAQSLGARMGLFMGGLGTIAGGTVLMYRATAHEAARCPVNASVYRVEVPTGAASSRRETVCVQTSARGGSVYTPGQGGIPGTSTLARPGQLWTGTAMLGGGALLMYLGARAPRVAKTAPTVLVTPGRIAASATLTF